MSSGIITHIIVLLAFNPSPDLLRLFFMENAFSHIMSIRLLADLMQREKVLCMHLILSGAMNDYNVVLVVLLQVLLCHSSIIKYISFPVWALMIRWILRINTWQMENLIL